MSLNTIKKHLIFNHFLIRNKRVLKDLKVQYMLVLLEKTSIYRGPK